MVLDVHDIDDAHARALAIEKFKLVKGGNISERIASNIDAMASQVGRAPHALVHSPATRTRFRRWHAGQYRAIRTSSSWRSTSPPTDGGDCIRRNHLCEISHNRFRRTASSARRSTAGISHRTSVTSGRTPDAIEHRLLGPLGKVGHGRGAVGYLRPELCEDRQIAMSRAVTHSRLRRRRYRRAAHARSERFCFDRRASSPSSRLSVASHEASALRRIGSY